MGHLVAVQHNRGATSGTVFVEALGLIIDLERQAVNISKLTNAKLSVNIP